MTFAEYESWVHKKTGASVAFIAGTNIVAIAMLVVVLYSTIPSAWLRWPTYIIAASLIGAHALLAATYILRPSSRRG